MSLGGFGVSIGGVRILRDIQNLRFCIAKLPLFGAARRTLVFLAHNKRQRNNCAKGKQFVKHPFSGVVLVSGSLQSSSHFYFFS